MAAGICAVYRQVETTGKVHAGAFALRGGWNIAALRERYRAQGYLHVPDVLEAAGAHALHQALAAQTRWSLVFNEGDKHHDYPQAQIDALPQEQAARLLGAIHAQAREGFQYYYNNYPIYDAMHAGIDAGHPLHAFLSWLGADEFMGFVRAVTGHEDISHVDAQATRYGPGHFLSVHDDSAPGKNRRAAYVFNFTPRWRVDWGGVLQLIAPDGHVRAGLSPVFNGLNLLAVPQPHSVSMVTPFAGAARLSITGWLRYE